MTEEPDYISVIPASIPHKFNVVVMKWNRREDEYQLGKCSEALPDPAAQALAQSWASAMRLEIRR